MPKRLAAAAFFVLLTMAACNGGGTPLSPTTPTPSPTPASTTASLAGEWRLLSFNGSSLPVTLSPVAGLSSEILGETLTLTAAGAFSDALQLRNTENGKVSSETKTTAGTYTVDGAAIRMVATTGDVVTGTVSGTRMTVNGNGNTGVFQKQ
jgi:hypothetical protein